MFQKDQSSVVSGGALKKGKDVPVRKSDRRKLLQQVQEQLLLLLAPSTKTIATQEAGHGVTPPEGTSTLVESTTTAVDSSNLSASSTDPHDAGKEDAAGWVSSDPARPPGWEAMLELAFLQGDLVARTLTLPSTFSATSSSSSTPAKVTLYFRSPSTGEDIETQASRVHAVSPSSQPTLWPVWPYTRSMQCIWMQVDESKTCQYAAPTVALLSALPSPLSSDEGPPARWRLPIVTVHPAVSKYVCRGAHLMRAGMRELWNAPKSIPTDHSAPHASATSTVKTQSSSRSPRPKATEVARTPSGQAHAGAGRKEEEVVTVVAIAVQGNAQPFAVGVLAPDLVPRGAAASVKWGPGTQGVGVHILTTYGDDIWQQQVPLPIAARRNDPSPFAIVSPWGGASYDQGHYGNVGFVRGELVHPLSTSNAPAMEDPDRDDEDNGIEQDQDMEAVKIDEGIDVKDKSISDSVKAADLVPTLTGEAANGEEGAAVQSLAIESNDVGHESGEATSAIAPDADLGLQTPHPTTPEEILHAAVGKALATLQPKRHLPMTMASFYAQYVLPNRPPGTSIELKQTRYKKFGAFVAEQVESGLLIVGPDASKTDPMAMLIDFNRRHPFVRPYILKEKEAANNSTTLSTSADPPRLVLVDLYCLPNHWEKLLRLDPAVVEAADATSEERRNTGMLTIKELRAILDDYIAREDLVDPSDPGRVILDGPLTDALFKAKKKADGSDGGAESGSPTWMGRKELITAWTNRAETAYCLVEMPGNRVVKLGRGLPPVVTIEVSLRQSKKFVTRVRGMEEFGVHAETLAKEVSHRFACSSSVEDQPEGRAALKKGFVELAFQGNLADELEALLIGDDSLTQHGGARDSQYRLPKNAVEVILKKGVPARKKRLTLKAKK